MALFATARVPKNSASAFSSTPARSRGSQPPITTITRATGPESRSSIDDGICHSSATHFAYYRRTAKLVQRRSRAQPDFHDTLFHHGSVLDHHIPHIARTVLFIGNLFQALGHPGRGEGSIHPKHSHNSCTKHFRCKHSIFTATTKSTVRTQAHISGRGQHFPAYVG